MTPIFLTDVGKTLQPFVSLILLQASDFLSVKEDIRREYQKRESAWRA